MISAYLIMDEVTLSEAAADAVRKTGAQWTVINARNGRQLVSAIAPLPVVLSIMAMIAAYHPLLIGVWTEEGTIVPGYEITPDKALAYVEVMPDILTSTSADAPPVCTRPDTPRDVHGWCGWAERQFQ